MENNNIDHSGAGHTLRAENIRAETFIEGQIRIDRLLINSENKEEVQDSVKSSTCYESLSYSC